ncbi:MAG: preprotein translocase subunit YajC [Prevotellaceae bacterium]|jgi:preprotein translocase subunit YajC|nr:preprotein translocase subunit YajC [Prevotellaceae bacterium]
MMFNFIVLFQDAAASTGQQGSSSTFFIMILLMFVVMWFFMIRPQQKKQKQLKEMRKTLGKGDKIITQGGIFGTIVDVKEEYFLVEIDNNVKIRVVKDLVFKDVTEIQQVK